ncbi:exopolysaccharide biosynthesis protein [Thalassospira sp. MA62]|nr:exopolysaccharide biosynthesis protein [Thalassospira sp. MA62]
MSSHKEVSSVEEIVRRIGRRAADQQQISVGDIVAELGQRSQGPFLLLPGLIGMSPISGIPLVPAFLALVIGVFSLQILIGRRELWLPDILARRQIEAQKVRRGLERVAPVAAWMDKWFGGRLEALVGGVAFRLVALVCGLLALCVPMFELVPFAGIAPMTAIAAFGLAIMVNDGLLMLAALGITGGTMVLLINIVASV